MSIQATWGSQDKTRIHVTFLGDWDWYDFYAAAGDITRLMMTVNHPVDVIMDMQASKPVPPDFAVHLGRTALRRPNLGAIVLVQPGSAPQQVHGIVHRLSGGSRRSGEMTYAANREEAQAVSAAPRNARERSGRPPPAGLPDPPAHQGLVDSKRRARTTMKLPCVLVGASLPE
jgi:hypothetical protein